MDLTKFKFPEPSLVLPTDPVLLKEAQSRGFRIGGISVYDDMFSTLFFNGGKVKFKEGLDPEFHHNAWAYLRAFMGSFEPKHEHKHAISAMLLSELVEPELDGG